MQAKTMDVQKAGYTFRIQKMLPRDGAFWAYRLIGGVKNIPRSEIEAKVMQVITSSKQDFETISRDLLGRVFVITERDSYPLVDPDGRFTVPDLDLFTHVELLSLSLEFTFQDFFGKGQVEPPINLAKSEDPSPATDSATSTHVRTGEPSFTPPSNTGTGDSMKPGMAPTTPPTGSTS